jgi:hypothetical protein
LIEKDSYRKYSQTEIYRDNIVNIFPIKNEEVLICTQSGFIYYLDKPKEFTQKVN